MEMDMGHDEISGRLSAYLDGEVGAEERVRIEEHLKGCGVCAGALEELRKIRGLLQRLSVRQADGAFLKRVHARVDAEIREAARRRVERFAGALSGLAACLAVVVGL